MEYPQLKRFTDQAMALAYNYIQTNRNNKAIELVGQVKKIDPDNKLAGQVMDLLFALQENTPRPDLSEEFGQYWLGESLEGKSIEIFCDQGMGDTINLLRYIHQLKMKWNCRVILNCYAFYQQFEELMKQIDYIDEFVNHHVPCNYCTNIMSLPALIFGLKFDCYYPVHWKEILSSTQIPNQPRIQFEPAELLGHDGQSMKIGLAWETNPNNQLSVIKSVPLSMICQMETGKWELYQLTPIKDHCNFLTQFILSSLAQTAAYIQSMDVVISVDTCVLHLAGAMGKKTYGLLPFDADPRWEDSDVCRLYPSVKLFRQGKDLDWLKPICEIKNELYKEVALR